MGINVGSAPIKAVYVGGTKAKAVYVGAELVWQDKIVMETDFNYGLSSNLRLSDASPDWIDRPDTAYIRAHTSGYAYSIGGSAGTYYPAAMWKTPLPQFDLAVSIRLSPILGLHFSVPCGIIIGAMGSGDEYLRLDLSAQKKELRILTTSHTNVSIWDVTSALSGLKDGDEVTLQRKVEGSWWRINVLVNGTQKWTISIAPRTMSPGVNHNVGGIHIQRTNGNNGRIDHFKIETI